jgi:hypothetical protein
MRGARFLPDDENAPAMRQAQARRRVAVANALRGAVPIVADEVVARVVLQRDVLNILLSAPSGGLEVGVVRNADGGMRLYIAAHEHAGTECLIDSSAFSGAIGAGAVNNLQELAEWIDANVTPP